MNRRRFVTGAGVAVSLNAFPFHLFANGAKKFAADRIKLGPQGIEASRLAMGTGTNGAGGSSNQTRKLGTQGVTELFRAGFDNGLTFWDSADQYGTHTHLRAALKSGIAREKVTIMSKTRASNGAEMKADLDRFRRELNTDYIDILLLHCMTDGDWNEKKRGAMDVIAEAQEKGIVRTRGISAHTIGALRTSAKEPWVEVQLARINPAGVAMDADPNTVVSVLREMKAAGKGVIGMKIFGAGKLRSKTDECLQFALSLDCVDCFTIGGESIEEMRQLTTKIPAASTRG